MRKGGSGYIERIGQAVLGTGVGLVSLVGCGNNYSGNVPPSLTLQSGKSEYKNMAVGDEGERVISAYDVDGDMFCYDVSISETSAEGFSRKNHLVMPLNLKGVVEYDGVKYPLKNVKTEETVFNDGSVLYVSPGRDEFSFTSNGKVTDYTFKSAGNSFDGVASFVAVYDGIGTSQVVVRAVDPKGKSGKLTFTDYVTRGEGDNGNGNGGNGGNSGLEDLVEWAPGHLPCSTVDGDVRVYTVDK